LSRERRGCVAIDGGGQNWGVAEINLFRSSREAYEVAAGDVLFREGDAGDVMFAVIEGEIDVERHGRVIEKVGPGGIIGELALIDASPRTASAIAGAPSRVVRVDQKQFLFLVQEHPTFAIQVMQVMAERLRHMNERAD
jgi:CRP/FNR family transcriptional regulator, cyclic AMP receptor protein